MPGCSKPHPTWSGMLTGVGNSQLLDVSVSQPSVKLCSLSPVLARGSAEQSCRKAERLLKKIQMWSEEEVPNKNELIGNLHSLIGNAQLAMGQMEAALRSHKMDLDCARQK